MNRTKAIENITLVDTTGYDNMINSFNETLDTKSFIDSLFYGSFGAYWNVGYLLLIGTIFYLMWHDQRSLLIPSITLLIIGRVIFTYIPESVVMYAHLFIIMGMAAIIVKLYRDGRQ